MSAVRPFGVVDMLENARCRPSGDIDELNPSAGIESAIVPSFLPERSNHANWN